MFPDLGEIYLMISLCCAFLFFVIPEISCFSSGNFPSGGSDSGTPLFEFDSRIFLFELG